MAATAALVLMPVLRVTVEGIGLRGATVDATSLASSKSATGMAAIAGIVLRLALRARVTTLLGATVRATSAASQRTATGMVGTAAIVLKLVLRVLVLQVIGAMVHVT